MYNTNIQPETTVSAIVTRADGTVEDLGIIASTTDTKNRVKMTYLYGFLDTLATNITKIKKTNFKWDFNKNKTHKQEEI